MIFDYMEINLENTALLYMKYKVHLIHFLKPVCFNVS